MPNRYLYAASVVVLAVTGWLFWSNNRTQHAQATAREHSQLVRVVGPGDRAVARYRPHVLSGWGNWPGASEPFYCFVKNVPESEPLFRICPVSKAAALDEHNGSYDLSLAPSPDNSPFKRVIRIQNSAIGCSALARELTADGFFATPNWYIAWLDCDRPQRQAIHLLVFDISRSETTFEGDILEFDAGKQHEAHGAVDQLAIAYHAATGSVLVAWREIALDFDTHILLGRVPVASLLSETRPSMEFHDVTPPHSRHNHTPSFIRTGAELFLSVGTGTRYGLFAFADSASMAVATIGADGDIEEFRTLADPDAVDDILEIDAGHLINYYSMHTGAIRAVRFDDLPDAK